MSRLASSIVKNSIKILKVKNLKKEIISKRSKKSPKFRKNQNTLMPIWRRNCYSWIARTKLATLNINTPFQTWITSLVERKMIQYLLQTIKTFKLLNLRLKTKTFHLVYQKLKNLCRLLMITLGLNSLIILKCLLNRELKEDRLPITQLIAKEA